MQKEKNIKILHIITRLIVGGAQENVLFRTNYLAQNGFDVYLVSGPTSGPEGHIPLEGIKDKVKFFIIPELVREINIFKDTIALTKLYLFIKRNGFDIVHTHTSKAGVLGRLAAKLAKVPIIIYTPHGNMFYGYYGKFRTSCLIWVERALAHITSCIIALTERGKKEHIDFGIAEPHKFKVVPDGIDMDAFLKNDQKRLDNLRTEFGLSPDKKIVGIVARLVPIKGHSYFIDAAEKVIRKIPQSRFMIVGDGILRANLERIVDKKNLSNYFYFLGLRNDIPDLLALFDIFVLCSLNEGMGSIIIKAMASAKPVVATRVGGIPEVVIDEETGILVEPKDKDSLAEGIISLLRDEEKAKSMGEAGRRKVKDIFLNDEMARKETEIYNEFLVNRKEVKDGLYLEKEEIIGNRAPSG